jgi:translocation and assembly module TamB
LKALRIAAIAFAAVLLLAAGACAWALFTESGAAGLWALASRALPAGLSIAELRGTVAGTLHLRRLHYRDATLGIDLRIDDVELQTAALALFSRRVHVQRARVDGATLQLFAATAAPRAARARDPWTAPIDLQVDELRLTRGELRRENAAPLELRSVRLAASWIGADIAAPLLEIESPDGEISLSARFGPPAPRLKSLRAKFRWRGGRQPWAGTLVGRGGDESFTLQAALDAPVKMSVAGTFAGLRGGAQESTWRAHLSAPRFDPHPLIQTDRFRTLALELDAQGNRTQLALRGVVAVDQDRVHIESLNLSRHERWIDIAALRLRLNAQPASLTGSARLSLDGARPSSAELAWDEMELPAAWAGANFRCSGRVAMSRFERRFAAHATARIARGEKHSTLALRLDGSRDRLQIRELELTQLPGTLSMTGDVDLSPPIRWNVGIRARAFDPSMFIDRWPGALDFDLATHGEWPPAGPRAAFRLTHLAGTLRRRSLSGSADVQLGPDLRPSGRLHLRSGDATLEATARRDAQPRIDARLHIGALDAWRSDLRGRLDATLAAVGRWPRVETELRLEAAALHARGLRADSATLHIRAQDAREPRGSANLSAAGLALGEFEFGRLTAKLEGDRHAHAFEVGAQGNALSVALHATGALAGKAWSGTLDRLRIEIAKVPSLESTQPSRLHVTREYFDLGNTCLSGGEISLCAGVRRDAHALRANYSIRALPLAVVMALAAPRATLSVAGSFTGVGELQRAADGGLSGRASLGSAAGSWQTANSRALVLEYRDFGIELEVAGAVARATLRGVLPRQGDLQGAVTLRLAAKDPVLEGRAALRLQDVAPLAVWVPQLANLRGSAEVTAELAGTLRAPRLGLALRATGLDAEIPLLGVHLEKGSLDARLRPDGAFDARGTLRSGDGTVEVTGSRGQSGIALGLEGTNFLAADIPGARVSIAPDLALSGRLGQFMLTGTVRVGDADVNLEKLSLARNYRASADVVVLDRATPEAGDSLALGADVRIILGEGVKLSGFGLDATVSGELRVHEERERQSRATGEIRLSGSYEAFGRKLSIERGRLQFTGTALDDPQLDILAQRKLQDVTARLRVSGTAQHPKLEVFTDPATSQADAMSYLITGKAASEAHGEEGAIVNSAAQSVGSLLGNRLAKRLGGKMSFIDEIGVEQNADLGGNAFTVGKYLSPRFFISYGVGLFEPGSTMTVRYEFSRHWSLEANQAPEDGHAGIRYRIEK